MANSDQDCRACLVGIGKIETRLIMLNGSIMKIVYALLGVIGANIGTKYIGTPWYVYCAMYASMFAGIFVFCITITKWKCLNGCERWIRLTFVLSVLYASILRIFHYQIDTPLTQIEGVFSNLINLSLAIGFIVLAWRRDAYRRTKLRRYNDEPDQNR